MHDGAQDGNPGKHQRKRKTQTRARECVCVCVCVCASTRRVFLYARLSIPYVRAKHAEEGFPPCVGGHEVPGARNAAAAVKRGGNGGIFISGAKESSLTSK